MLRNFRLTGKPTVFNQQILNEVLSLNAQELDRSARTARTRWVLNEVLSLNAQESMQRTCGRCSIAILNEVLSLNAQECGVSR